MSHIIGIDLWTQGSCAVCMLDGKGYIVPKTDGHALDKEKTCTQKLSYCRYAAQDWLQGPIGGAVITVPSGFDLVQRQAVLDAGKAAGFDQVRLVTEPSAAALAWGRRVMREGKEAVFLTCTLSGHNLSLCTAVVEDGVVEIQGCAALEFYPELGWTPDAERAVRGMMEPRRPDYAFAAGDAAGNQDIIAALERLTGEPYTPNQKTYLALGAAILGAIMDWEEKDVMLLDALPSGLWLWTGDNTAEVVFCSSTTIPCRTTKTVRRDSQPSLVQGGRIVRRLRWEDLVPAGWKEDQAQITFGMDAHGLLDVRFEESENKPQPSEKPSAPDAALSPEKQSGAKEAVLTMLPVYDNLERAVRQDTRDSAYKKGVEMTLMGLKDALSKLGVTEIPALGRPFDPNLHNAVMHIQDGSFGTNVVSQVYQAGFMMGDKVIRFAAVQVAN